MPRSGRAVACRNEPNAVGIPKKVRPSMYADAFFSDADYERAKWAFDEAFIRMAKHLSDGGTVIWPADGIGTGRALLAERAPRIWNYLERCRERSEEHTSELQSLMRISYAVFCLKKKTTKKNTTRNNKKDKTSMN